MNILFVFVLHLCNENDIYEKFVFCTPVIVGATCPVGLNVKHCLIYYCIKLLKHR